MDSNDPRRSRPNSQAFPQSHYGQQQPVYYPPQSPYQQPPPGMHPQYPVIPPYPQQPMHYPYSNQQQSIYAPQPPLPNPLPPAGNNSKAAAIASWIRETPLPTALAFDQGSIASGSVHGSHQADQDSSDDDRRRRNRNYKSSKQAATTPSFQPGRKSGTGASQSAAIVVKTEDEKEREAKAERKAMRKGTGGWVQPVGHEASTIYYNPKNPRVKSAVGGGGGVEKVKPANAVSRKEALALAEAAKKEESEKYSSDADDSDDSDESEDEIPLNTAGDSDSDSDTAMDRVRDRMIQMAVEKKLADSNRRNSSSSISENGVDGALGGVSERDFLFRRPGRAPSSYNPPSKAADSIDSNEPLATAKELLANESEADASDSDYENPLVKSYFNSLAIDPPQDENDEDDDNKSLAHFIKSTQENSAAEADEPNQDAPEQSEENQLRIHIYTNLVPRVQHPKTDPTGSLEAVNQIIPEIHKLSNYPSDQKSLSELCILVLQRIAILPSMINETISDAQLLLANIYVQGIPNYDSGTFKPDYHRAFVLYESASKRGNVDAVFNVALCHEKGCGTGISFPKAIHNYKKAALRNHPGAMFRLGTALMTASLGMPLNQRDGIKWIRLSTKYATKTYPHALYEFAMMHENGVTGLVYEDHQFMVETLSQGALLGHAGCQVKLGEIYGDGLYGYSKDVGKSVYFYSLAAENGSPEGMFALGGIYLTGAHDETTNIHLDKSVQEAVRWVSLAAECNLPRALFAMGYFAEKGMSANGKSKPDEKAALLWYKKAALGGDEKAVARLQELGIQLDWKAFKKLEAAQERGGTWTGGSILQLGGGVGVSKLKEGVAVGLDQMKHRASGRHMEVDEELDGGHKCAVM
ncbi:UNVERIFIED_CONTAM: hypothetical protein HDU68_004524 [Siphonaria sp. JEL0065]|nr:hypothetical protein HDU68_004524 [Siphonaria sp. JEL0065]